MKSTIIQLAATVSTATAVYAAQPTDQGSENSGKGQHIAKASAEANAKPGVASKLLTLKKDDRISIVGAGLASRMMKYSHFETELHLRNPDKNLIIRNLADEGNTPAFRPHPGVSDQFAFPGGEDLYKKYNYGCLLYTSPSPRD